MKLRLLPALLFLVVFFFIPLGAILAAGWDEALFASLPTFLPRALRVISFTFWQAFLSSLLTLAVGLPLAFLFARYQFAGKSFLKIITAIPFLLPTVVVAAGFNALLGARGWLNLAWMHLTHSSTPAFTFVGTLAAVLVAHTFYNAIIVIRLVGAAWEQLDPRLSQAARVLGANPWQTFWRITLPLLAPSILASGLLVFLFDFTSFGVILLLGAPGKTTLEVEIYIQALHLLNLPAAASLSLFQLLSTLAFSIFYSRLLPALSAPAKPTRQERLLPRRRLDHALVGFLSLFIFLFYALPLLALPLRSITRLEAERAQSALTAPGFTTSYYTELFFNRRGSLFYVPPIQAAQNSLTYAAITVFLSLSIGIPAAYALTRPSRLEAWFDPLLMLPLGTSSVTLGLGYILTFNRPLWQGSASLLASPWLVPLAHTTIALPFIIRNLQAALLTIPPLYREAAATLGATPWQVWRSVDFPILSRAALSAAAFAFTISMGEFGAATLLARPEYPTLPMAIYRFLSQPGALNYGQAMAMATLLMLLTGLCIWLIERLRVGNGL